MLFIDASVIVAILAGEDDAYELMDRLEREEGEFYVSPVARMEATLSLSRRLAKAKAREKSVTPEIIQRARSIVDQFLVDIEAKEATITADVGHKAIDAALIYGKIVNHPAKLNMGDCFAYACAQAYRTKIAYKGDDFTHTDLGW